MSATGTTLTEPQALWSPAPGLCPRVKRLRDQYWDFYHRDVTNEVRAYTCATPWDQVYAPWNWTGPSGGEWAFA